MRRFALLVALALGLASTALAATAPGVLAQNDTNDTNDTNASDASSPGQQATGSAAFTVTCNQLRCTFDAREVTLENGSIASYSWDFGDGDDGDGAVINHTYATPDTYNVTLTVESEDGDTRNETQTVTVSADRHGNQDVVPWSALAVGGIALAGSIVVSRMT